MGVALLVLLVATTAGVVGVAGPAHSASQATTPRPDASLTVGAAPLVSAPTTTTTVPPTTTTTAAPTTTTTAPPAPATTQPAAPATTVPAPATASASATAGGYGCGPALAYLAANAAPGFSFECPGWADGHQAMTCINTPGVCSGEKVIAISVPCPAAYMNEASNSWVLEGLRSAPIDPYGYCPE